MGRMPSGQGRDSCRPSSGRMRCLARPQLLTGVGVAVRGRVCACVRCTDGEEQASLCSNCLAFNIFLGLSAGCEAPAMLRRTGIAKLARVALGGCLPVSLSLGYVCSPFLDSTHGIVCASCL